MSESMVNRIQSKQVRINGLNVHYLTGGQGDPLLVIHGGSEGAWAWRQNAEALADRYTVYVPDMPGFGQSEPLTGDYYIPELAEFVDCFSREVGLEKFHLLGHSLGGGVALSYALKFPYKITKLVLVSSLCLGKEIALWVRCLTRPKLARCIGKAALAVLRAVKWMAEALVLAPFEFAMPFSPASFYLGSCITTLEHQTTVLLHRLSELVMPTLIVWGARDPIVPFRQAYAAAALIPDCEVKVFDGSGHSVYREKLDDFSQTLRGFLG